MKSTTCFKCDESVEHDHHVVPCSKGGTRTIPVYILCHTKIHDVRSMSGSELTKAALQAKKRRGERVGSIPFGSRLGADGHLEPDPAEQDVIRILKAAM